MTLARTPLASLAALAAALILLVTTAGCGDESRAAGQAPTPVPGGTYIVPLEWDPPSIEPLNTYASEGGMVVDHAAFRVIGVQRFDGRRVPLQRNDVGATGDGGRRLTGRAALVTAAGGRDQQDQGRGQRGKGRERCPSECHAAP